MLSDACFGFYCKLEKCVFSIEVSSNKREWVRELSLDLVLKQRSFSSCSKKK